MAWTIAVSVIGVMGLVPPAIAVQRDGLFSTVNRPAEHLDSPVLTSHDATIVRHRLVTIDLEQLHRARAAADVLPRPFVSTKAVSPSSGNRDAAPAADATLIVNLFEDVVFTGIAEWTAPTFSGGYSISGRLAGEPLGTLTIVVNGETVAGTVRTLGGTYRIRSVGRGQCAISEVEETPFKCEVEGPQSETGAEP